MCNHDNLVGIEEGVWEETWHDDVLLCEEKDWAVCVDCGEDFLINPAFGLAA